MNEIENIRKQKQKVARKRMLYMRLHMILPGLKLYEALEMKKGKCSNSALSLPREREMLFNDFKSGVTTFKINQK